MQSKNKNMFDYIAYTINIPIIPFFKKIQLILNIIIIILNQKIKPKHQK
jgi:hypothetical protein